MAPARLTFEAPRTATETTARLRIHELLALRGLRPEPPGIDRLFVAQDAGIVVMKRQVPPDVAARRRLQDEAFTYTRSRLEWSRRLAGGAIVALLGSFLVRWFG